MVVVVVFLLGGAVEVVVVDVGGGVEAVECSGGGRGGVVEGRAGDLVLDEAEDVCQEEFLVAGSAS